jgi:ribosome maturation factor RimP
MGAFCPFFVCAGTCEAMDLHELLETTLAGLGYELVDLERSGRGKLLRVFIDKPDGVGVEDCVAVSGHLSRLFAVEGIDYDRLEISSPGLDRPLKKASDFIRFAGESAKLKLRVALQGQRNFVGILREVNDGVLKLEVDGKMLDLELSNLEKARLVPKL